jgi:hypothetical protein
VVIIVLVLTLLVSFVDGILGIYVPGFCFSLRFGTYIPSILQLGDVLVLDSF